MSKSYIRKLEAMADEGNYQQAAMLAVRYLQERAFEKMPGQLVRLMERCAENYDMAKLALIRLYTFGIFKEPHEGAGSEIAERLIKGPDREIRRHAHVALGIYHVMHGRPHLGMKTLREASISGVPEARIAMALLYKGGAPGLEPDFDRGMSMLMDAADDKVPTARVCLAKVLIEEGLEIEGFELDEMLLEAIEDDDLADEARQILDRISSDDDEVDGEHALDILPYEVVPDGMARPKAARKQLMDKIGMPQEAAAFVVARLSGFECWCELTAAAENPDMPKGVFDEDCSPDDLADRREMQTEVLVSHGFLDETVAAKVAEMIAVTGRSGSQSLRRLEEELSADEEEHGRLSLRNNGTANLDMDLEAHLMGFLRWMSGGPDIRPKAWISTLERFGWRLRNKRPKVRKDGSLIAEAPARDGTDYGVFLCSGSYLPGEEENEEVEGRMADIAKIGKPAVLLFNRPIGLVSPKRKKGLLFGGRMFSGKEWWDFVLRPDGGVDDAIGQRGKLQGKPSSAFVKEYSFSNAREACVEIAAASDGGAIEEGDTVSFIQYPSGWATAVTGIGAAFLRIAAEIER